MMAHVVHVLLLCACVMAEEDVSLAESIAVSYSVFPTSTVDSETLSLYYMPDPTPSTMDSDLYYMPDPSPSTMDSEPSSLFYMPDPTPSAAPPQMEPSQTNTEDVYSATDIFSYTEQVTPTTSLAQIFPCSSACGTSTLTTDARHLTSTTNTVPITSSRTVATTRMPSTDKTLIERITLLPLWVWFVVAIGCLFLFSGCIVFCITCCYCCTLRNKSASHKISKEGQRRESVSQLLEKNVQPNQEINTDSEKKKVRPVSRWDSWRNSRRRVSTFKPQLYPTEDLQQQDIATDTIKKQGIDQTNSNNDRKNPETTAVLEGDTKLSWHNPANSQPQPYTTPDTSQTNAHPPSYNSSSNDQYQLNSSPNYDTTQQSYGNPSNIYPNYTNSYSASCGIPEGYSNPNTNYSGHENSQADLTTDSANGYYNPLFEMKEPHVGTQENNAEPAQSQTFRMIQKFSQGK